MKADRAGGECERVEALENQPFGIGTTFRLFELVSAVKHLLTRVL